MPSRPGAPVFAPDPGARIASVQILRFVAAALVVLVHASHSMISYLGATALPMFDMGNYGVDLFFVISGVIMVRIGLGTRRTPAAFFARRAARILPAYWVATSLMLGVLVVAPGLLKSSALDPAHVLASYLMIPWPNPVQPEMIKPLLHVGWSLMLEMQFYTLFALCLLARPDWRVPLVTAALTACVVLGWTLGAEGPMMVVWTAPLLLEFMLGLGIGVACAAGLRCDPRMGLVLVATGALGLMLAEYRGGFTDPWRWLSAGVPAAAIVLGALMCESSARVQRAVWLQRLGDTSFSLYLSHYFVLGALRAVWPGGEVSGLGPELAFLGTALGLCILGGVAFYLAVERPLVRLAQRGTAGARAAPLPRRAAVRKS